MKKSKFIIILILVVILIMGSFVYATKEQKQNKNKLFLSVDKEEASSGEIVTMTLDLSQVEYDEFVLTIQADKQIINNSEINTQEDSNNNKVAVMEKEDIILEKENDLTMKLYANKQNLCSSEIKLCFIVPDTLNIGDKINIYATIEEINSDSLNNEESEKIKTETQEMDQA